MVAVVLLVAVVVVLAGTVFVFVDGAAEGLRQPAPQVAESTAALQSHDGSRGGVVTVSHSGGDPVPVANVRVIVDTSGVTGCVADRAEIQNLPSTQADGGYNASNLATGEDSPVANGAPTGNWSAGALHADTDPNFGVTDSFAFRLDETACPVAAGETVGVTVVHEPSRQEILSVRVTAGADG